jgi:hypothetical protein
MCIFPFSSWIRETERLYQPVQEIILLIFRARVFFFTSEAFFSMLEKSFSVVEHFFSVLEESFSALEHFFSVL